MRIVVLGGGLMGTATAYFLLAHPKAPKSLKVTLLDRGEIGAGATVASFGNVRRQGRDFRQMALAHLSLSLWNRLDQMLGCDVEFRATGHVRAVFHQESLQDMQRFATAARDHGLEIELLDQTELRQRCPFLSHEAVAASFSPNDGSGNPRLIAPAFARAAERFGLELRPHTQVDVVQPSPDGFTVETPDEILQADIVVNAAGAWGGALAGTLGEPVPITPYAPQMGVTEPMRHRILPVVGVWARRTEEVVYCRQVERGNIVFGGGLREDVALYPGHAKVDPQKTLRQLEELVRLVPALRHTQVIRTWSGCEGYVADMLPVMGRSAQHGALFHAFGFCGHGFQLGPGVGSEMADLILTGSSQTDLDPFRIGRFRRSPAEAA